MLPLSPYNTKQVPLSHLLVGLSFFPVVSVLFRLLCLLS